MPPFETMDRPHKAVLWPNATKDGYGVMKLGSGALDLKVRWSDRQTQALDPAGEVISVDASVISTRDIPIGAAMWRGTVATWNANLMNQIMEVVSISKADDTRGRSTRKKYGLKFVASQVPS